MRSTFKLGPSAAPAPRRHGIRPALFYGMFTALFGLNVVLGTTIMMGGDIARLVNGQNEMVLVAYEDRIAELRLEVDRLHSRQYAQAGDINLQLQELAQQQDLLTEQHQFVKALANKATELGITAAALPDRDSESTDHAALIPASGNGFGIAQKSAALAGMLDDSRMALAAISEEATASTARIVTELSGVGIKPTLPEGTEAMGGPLMPAIGTADGLDLVDDANAVMAALVRLRAARTAADEAPVHQPVASNGRTSSRFGNRRDPFTGVRAFHSGIDFPAPTGTSVLSAGDGVVSFVGQKSGYGNVVEVTHPGGLVTRYGHLSAFLARQGQAVKTGTPIAKVGSTGRSTGPHLHFEVRRKDTAIDPAAFLAAGKRLQRFFEAA